MSNSSRRLSRGDRGRNDRLVRLRAVVTRQTAVLAFDLAADKQVCALAGQDSRVLARRTVTAKAWQLAEAVQWGLAQAAAAGFSSVVVACEATGHRWRVLDQIAEQAGVRLVCVQPLLVTAAGRARTSPAIRATRPTRLSSPGWSPSCAATWPNAPNPAGRGCGTSAPAGPAWSPTPSLPASRSPICWSALAGRAAGGRQADGVQELAGGDDRAAGPGRDQGDLGVIRRWGWSRFGAAVRGELARHGTTRWYSAIVRAVFDAATDPALAAAGVADQRAALWSGPGSRWATWPMPAPRSPSCRPHGCGPRRARGGPACDSIPGLSAVGAAAILADYRRSHPVLLRPGAGQTRRALPPRQRLRHLPGQDRYQRPRPPLQLRLAAWRAVYAALHSNPVLAARYAHLTGRTRTSSPPPRPGSRSPAACCVNSTPSCTTGTAWDPAIAAGRTPHAKEAPLPPNPDTRR